MFVSTMNTEKISREQFREKFHPKPTSLSSCGHFFKKLTPCLTTRVNPKNTPNSNTPAVESIGEDISVLVELNVPSEILSDSQVKELGKRLPPIAAGGIWRLSFSTTNHGFTLHALYRQMELIKNDLPVLLVIQDTQNNVFGVLASNPVKISETFYGLGCTFLFRFAPALQVFSWYGTNFYFIRGDADFVCFGSGRGKSGLWLDGDLNKGRTETCETFNNPPLVSEQDFIVKTLEVWTFGL